MTYISIMKLFLPALSGFFISRFICPMNKKDTKSSFQPPSYIFPIVWFILYVLLGISWMKSPSTLVHNSVYFLITFSLCLWIVAYSCYKRKRLGIYVILLSMFFTTVAMIQGKKINQLLLTPLLLWLLFAVFLNIDIVLQK